MENAKIAKLKWDILSNLGPFLRVILQMDVLQIGLRAKIQQKSYGIPVMEIHFQGLMVVCGEAFLLNSGDKQRRHLWQQKSQSRFLRKLCYFYMDESYDERMIVMLYSDSRSLGRDLRTNTGLTHFSPSAIKTMWRTRGFLWHDRRVA